MRARSTAGKTPTAREAALCSAALWLLAQKFPCQRRGPKLVKWVRQTGKSTARAWQRQVAATVVGG
eukprot:100368-Amphidinium_carterae.1